jgi:hypothetical protein
MCYLSLCTKTRDKCDKHSHHLQAGFMSYGIQSAPAGNGAYCAYKALWFEVIRAAFLSAMKGDRSSVLWLTATDGDFSELCQLLNLDARAIRNQVSNRKDVTK